MRMSNYLISTLKENPVEASVDSHRLMLRAGMIRQIASGVYTWLPTGMRVLSKVTKIVREEMGPHLCFRDCYADWFSLLNCGKNQVATLNMALNYAVLKIANKTSLP